MASSVGGLQAGLSPDFRNRVVLAGRDLTRAERTAAQIGYGVRGGQIDVADEASIATALSGVALVVSCIDQPGRKLFSAALQRGLRYTDITPHLNALGRGSAYDDLVEKARATGACIVLGTGIVPGISNVMTRYLADRLGGADEIETDLFLNANDVSGRASFEYFLQELSLPFKVWVDSREQPAMPYTKSRMVSFPDPIGRRSAYLFPFSDQVLYPRTMGVRTAVTRLAIDPVWLSMLLEVLARTGAVQVLANSSLRRAIARTRRDRPSTDGLPFALRVEVRRDKRSGVATLLGRTQADAAAAGALEVLRCLLAGDRIAPGAWMPEQVVEPRPFLERIREGAFVTSLAISDESQPFKGSSASAG